MAGPGLGRRGRESDLPAFNNKGSRKQPNKREEGFLEGIADYPQHRMSSAGRPNTAGTTTESSIGLNRGPAQPVRGRGQWCVHRCLNPMPEGIVRAIQDRGLSGVEIQLHSRLDSSDSLRAGLASGHVSPFVASRPGARHGLPQRQNARGIDPKANRVETYVDTGVYVATRDNSQ